MKIKSLEFRVRKVQATNDVEKKLQKKQPSRVYVSEDAILELTGSRDGGKPVRVERIVDGNQTAKEHEATLWMWKATEKLNKTVVLMYDPFIRACGYRLENNVRISLLGSATLDDAGEVVLTEEPNSDVGPLTADIDLAGWQYFLTGRLSSVEHVHAGLAFKNVWLLGPERSFTVISVDGRPGGNARFVAGKTNVEIARPSGPKQRTDSRNRGRLEVTGIRGLEPQIEELNLILGCFDEMLPGEAGESFWGTILHGGHGTGKSMLLDSIAQTGWGTVFRIHWKDKLLEIQEALREARLHQPSILLIDDLGKLVDKERNNHAAVIHTLCEAMDSLDADAVAKQEQPKVAVVATCLDYLDLPEELRRIGRFSEEILLPLPDVSGRREILASKKLFTDLCEEDEREFVRRLAEKTHAYNGNDLCRLVKKAKFVGRKRILKDREEHTAEHDETLEEGERTDQKEGGDGARVPELFHAEDYETALKIVRPSAMHDVNLKPPPVRWGDIHGQESVKAALCRAVSLMTEPDHEIALFFDRRPVGFLLYGPPGCSKTMAAQAMATEAGFNFFAVKGAELLNMYVGESERAVRRLFQRAREAAPAIIFFDEIDSIAGQRAGFSSSSPTNNSAGGSGGGHGVSVVTTLLNEMDGFEALSGVVVLAATNRPYAIDPALLRPGRFDELIYVGPPNAVARGAMLRRFFETRGGGLSPADFERLAVETDGCSGAEVIGLCRAAGKLAHDRRRTEGGRAGITMEDLRLALRGAKRQITKDVLHAFELWESQFHY